MTGKEASDRPPMIHHSAQGGFAIRDGKWKLVMEHRKQTRELYDLSADPSEKQNVLADHPDIESQMTERISTIVRQGRSTSGKPQPNDTPLWDDLSWMQE